MMSPYFFITFVFAFTRCLRSTALVVLKQISGGKTLPTEDARVLMQTLRCLANGFVISGMLWAAALAVLLDGRLLRAAGTCHRSALLKNVEGSVT